jgi:hypothetical protein
MPKKIIISIVTILILILVIVIYFQTQPKANNSTTKIVEKSNIELKPIIETQALEEVSSNITQVKTDKSTKIKYAQNNQDKTDQRAVIENGTKQLPFTHIQNMSTLDENTVIVASFIPQTTQKTGKKLEDVNLELLTKADNPKQGIYIYNYKTQESIKVFGGNQYRHWFDFIKLPPIEGNNLIVINTGQTLEIVDYKGRQVKTLFANAENIGSSVSRIVIKPLASQEDGKLKFTLTDKQGNIKHLSAVF